MTSIDRAGTRPSQGRGSLALRAALLSLAIAAAFPAAAQTAAAPALPWWRTATGPAYQVLVYSFADSDGDGWGDLRGLTAKLDWLNDGNPATTEDLGISAIWLSPINPATSYHGYDVTDYKAVSPRLGTLADFDAFVAEAHKRGIKVILDEVFNHSSSSHPWFREALADPSGPYGRYYRFRQPGASYGSGGMGRFYSATAPDGSSREFFSAFWSGMPDLDAGNTDVVNEFKGILRFWLERGVDGFRFDAAKHVFDPNEIAPGDPALALNRAFWNDLRRAARRIKPDVLFIGEVLTENPLEVGGYSGAFDMLFDFPSAKRILSLSTDAGGSAFAAAYVRDAANYAKAPGFTLAPLLSNHDQDRSMALLLQKAGANAIEGWGPSPGEAPAAAAAKKAALARARLDAAIVATLPGLPFIYYGEELGMTGRRYANDDVARRDAYPWNPERRAPTTTWARSTGHLEPGENSRTPSALEQAADPASLLSFYRRLSALRALLPALGDAALALPDWPGLDLPGVLAWTLSSGERRWLVVHVPGPLAFLPPPPPGKSLAPVWSSAAPGDGGSVPAGESAVFEITN